MHIEETPIVADKKTIVELRALANDTSKPRISMRASIILASLKGASCEKVAQKLDTDVESVILWRQRYAQYGISGLRDMAKYKDRKILGEDPLKQPVLELLAQDPPPGKLYWSTNSLAEALQVSPREVQRCLQREHIKMLEQRILMRQRKWERRFGKGEAASAIPKPQGAPAPETPPEAAPETPPAAAPEQSETPPAEA